ncbi:DinB family protein [Chryseosolibacter indicus]|uniref:DinB family protein n=1 Tax=Chryseosolibacter indicus TaxID=2782351 RepID=A0ABS5VUX9_9BACT|nr:DinB family protein [Chryseosolibacter indicus]MBT1703801.1 DinB family protein [Chryseosolibacter indicus]
MTQLEALRREFEKEAITTRKMLTQVPTDKFNWQPHPKSMTIKRLAAHIAELPTWIGMVFNTDELDFENNPYQVEDVNTTAELLAYFEKSVEDGRKHLKDGKEEVLDKPWTLRSGSTIFSIDPKRDVLRMAFSQVIHHRAQLGVYLRLLNIPIPGSYGPSADEL